MNDWMKGLSKVQAGLIGGVAGYFLGLLSGPVVRLILTLVVLVVFGIVGRSIESRFEAHLGFTGIVAAILAIASLGPIQRWMGELLGDLFTGVSRLALTIVGVYLALHVHQGAQNQFEDET
jgi:hypothetical protein